MSELIQKHDNRATIRWKLLTGASALVLTAYVSASPANAEDASRPQLWIELGGQLNRLQDGQEIYAPPFVALTQPDFVPPQKAEKPPLYGFSENAVLTFRPEDSDWLFSASIRYGRASSGKHVHHQSNPASFTGYFKNMKTTGFRSSGTFHTSPLAARFTDARSNQSERQTILDFQAGKDVGLGLFGRNAQSSMAFGVRFAQFTSQSQVELREDPDWHFSAHNHTYYFPPNVKKGRPARTLILQSAYQPFHSYAGSFEADRSFHGVGPSLSWQSSLPFAGNDQSGALAIDWGVNVALLFGRQRTRTQHQTMARYDAGTYSHPASMTTVYVHGPYSHTRSRSVTVPNVGGAIGLSWKLQDFKVNFGYKADFFFGAIDGGIDAAKKENRAFYGPYASISIGLGD